MMVLTPAEPVIETPAASTDASTFWKLVTLVASPLVWSPAARLTVAATFSDSVLTPAPPSIDVSAPR